MKPSNVTSVLFLGPQVSQKSSFLIQGALHYAEQGHTVVYITANEFDCLPPPVRGQSRPAPEVLSLIKFMYLPLWQDLLHHLASLHLHALAPAVLIVEALEHFCLETENNTSVNHHSNAADASRAALICAALLDGAAVCAKRLKTQSRLLVSINQEVPHSKLSPLIDIFFTDIVWVYQILKANNQNNESEEFSMTNLETAGSHIRQYKIFFSLEENDGAVVLNRVIFWDKIGRV